LNILGLSASAQIAVAAGVVVIIVLAGVMYAVLKDRRSKQPVPANLKPYLDDDELETTRLERVLTYAVWGLVVCALLMGYYFVTEPARQAAAFDRIEEERIEKGAKVYGPDKTPEGHPIAGSANCQSCHGPDLGGGSAKYFPKDPLTGEPAKESVTWIAPALNTIFLKYQPDQIRTIITYGRPGTPMPAWGIKGGGPLSEQQIEDAMMFIESKQISPDAAKAKSDEALALEKTVDPAQSDGAALFNTNCARCHTIGWSYLGGRPADRALTIPGSGGFGPSLRNGAVLEQFGAVAPVQNPEGTQNAYVADLGGEQYQPVNLLITYEVKANPSDSDKVKTIEATPPPFVALAPTDPADKRVFCGAQPTQVRTACIDGATEFKLQRKDLGAGPELWVADPELNAAGAVDYVEKPALLVPVRTPDGKQVTDAAGKPVSQVLVNKGLMDQETFVTKGSQWQQPYGQRGVGQGRMPGFGETLTSEQIEKIVRYERSL